MRFSLVVVSWNSEPELRGLLPTIERHLGDADCSLVLVDNGSDDGGAELVSSWSDSATVYRLEENRGYGAANNLGVRETDAEVVVLLNPDTLLVDGSLRELAALARDSRALCGPRLLNDDGTVQPSASAIPGSAEEVLRAALPARLLPRPLRLRSEPWRADTTRPVGWLTGACLAAPRDLLLELGPFDDGIHLYSEDIDLCLRAARRGVERLFAPDVARVVHLADRSSRRRFRDAGLALSIANRDLAVRRTLGPRRARLDAASQLIFHASRYSAKRLLRRDAGRELAWLRAWRRPSARSPRAR